jgi:hypothetical protein
MSKRSKRPGREARDVHAIIRADADRLKRMPRHANHTPADMPEVESLMMACRHAVTAATPSTVKFEGRTYWLRVGMLLKLEVFDAPGAAEPLLHGSVFGSDGFGHEPGH